MYSVQWVIVNVSFLVLNGNKLQCHPDKFDLSPFRCSSPVDMQSYELCCDMIDVVIDISCIYG